MARQRFIWPAIWKDPVFGRMKPDEQVFFIGCFSIADDEGRLLADPAYLRSELFPYREVTVKKVAAVRDSVVAQASSLVLYQAGGLDYLAFMKWQDYQKPKYPTPSKIPPPFLEDSLSVPEVLGEDSPMGRAGFGLGREGLGRVGLGGAGQDRDGKGRVGAASAAERAIEIERMLACTNDGDVVTSMDALLAVSDGLPAALLVKVRESAQRKSGTIGVGWLVNALRDERKGLAA